MLGDDAHMRELIQAKPDVVLWTMLERFLRVTSVEATIPEGDWLTPVALRSVGPLHVFSVYPHDFLKDLVLVNIFYAEDGRTKPFRVDRDQDDRLVLVKIAPDNTAHVIWNASG
jgi:hypothetical protein